MKCKHFLIPIAILLLGLNACKKNEVSEESGGEIETTFELSADQAIADNLTEDVGDVFMEAASDKDLLGNNILPQSPKTNNTLACATVTVSPLNEFPKTIIIDFGTGNCISPKGIIRKGKINIELTDSVRKHGSIATMTFEDYHVNNFKVEGTITWTNTSLPDSIISWERKIENGKITAPDAKYWLHNGIKNVVQTHGVNTPGDLTDDEFAITGTHTVTNVAGKTRECTIIEALQKKTACENISKGKLKLQGPNHYAIIDFGNGDCDKVATISIDGSTPKTILLR